MCISENIFRVIKSGRMNWAGHVIGMGRGEVYTGYRLANLREITIAKPGFE